MKPLTELMLDSLAVMLDYSSRMVYEVSSGMLAFLVVVMFPLPFRIDTMKMIHHVPA